MYRTKTTYKRRKTEKSRNKRDKKDDYKWNDYKRDDYKTDWKYYTAGKKRRTRKIRRR
jgi:hypothetical protein